MIQQHPLGPVQSRRVLHQLHALVQQGAPCTDHSMGRRQTVISASAGLHPFSSSFCSVCVSTKLYLPWDSAETWRWHFSYARWEHTPSSHRCLRERWMWREPGVKIPTQEQQRHTVRTFSEFNAHNTNTGTVFSFVDISTFLELEQTSVPFEGLTHRFKNVRL